MKSKFNLIFIGSGAIGCPLLKAFKQDDRFSIRLVITQPDQPVGRKLELKPNPIKMMAQEEALTVYQPANINEANSINTIHQLKADAIILISYGQILSDEVLYAPEFDSFNVHGSILPKYRGASPIQEAMLHAETETGITLMKMVKQMDAGPVYDSFEIHIESNDTSITLTEKLANLSACKIPDALYKALSEKGQPVEQNHQLATYCEKITKSDGEINWNESAKNIEAKIKAYTGWPGTFTFWNQKRLKVISGTAKNLSTSYHPGHIFTENNEVYVACGEGIICLQEVQLEGKKVQAVSEFVNGHSNFEQFN